MRVKDAMRKGVERVGADTPVIDLANVIDLAKLMRRHDIGAMPIGENPLNDPAGQSS
jgi:hypothetical protein